MEAQRIAYSIEYDGVDGLAHEERESTPVALARRVVDVLVAVVVLVLLAPVLLVAALAIKLDSRGPILFRQTRIGRDKKPFVVFKLRTMRTDADAKRHREYVRQLIEQQPDASAGGRAGIYKLAVDDRITRVGRVLRRLSVDELPQLLNVVRGHMSLVGPRPVIGYELDLYPLWYERRFAVKPGLTGLWQVSGRNERTYEEMIQLDIEYVERRTLRLDLTILARTAWVVLRGKGVA